MENSQTLGKYTVLERVGTGGMAEVFKCRPMGLGGVGKIVVVKRILPHHLGSPEFIRMFLDEARIAAHLNHPNLVHTYEIEEVDGAPQISMEYVHGLTFGELIQSSSGQDIARWRLIAAKVMAGVCEGLYAAHSATDAQGEALHLVHRDVTPQNILVSVDGVPKLADFGVVQAKGQLAEERTGTLKGKIKYMAPEQLQRGVPIDQRADIFSAGVCLYLATVGAFPYEGETDLEVIAKASAGSFLKPSERCADFPPELERIILWAMAPDREVRCSDARQLARALEAFVASHAPADRPCTAKTVGEKVRVARVALQALRRSQNAKPVTGGPSATASPAMPERGSLRDLGLEVAVRELATTGVDRPFWRDRLKRLAPSLAWVALAAIAAAAYWS